jgi:hypothetical protein
MCGAVAGPVVGSAGGNRFALTVTEPEPTLRLQLWTTDSGSSTTQHSVNGRPPGELNGQKGVGLNGPKGVGRGVDGHAGAGPPASAGGGGGGRTSTTLPTVAAEGSLAHSVLGGIISGNRARRLARFCVVQAVATLVRARRRPCVD